MPRESAPAPGPARGPRWRACAWGLLGALLLGSLTGLVAARSGPELLIERSAPEPADALIVLAGDHTGGRVDAAVALWQAGWVERGPFVVSGGQLYAELSWADVMRDRAQAAGVPLERIVTQGKSLTTAEDATLTAALAPLRPGQTVLLVTSPWHSGRAAALFRAAYGPEVRVVSCPAPPPYPEPWWRDARATRALATEVLKRLWPGAGTQ